RSRNAIGDHIAALLSAILGAHFDDSRVTIAELRRQVLEEHGPTLRAIVQRAVERGEIPGPTVPERITSLPFDLFRSELIMRFDRVPDETLVDIVDTAFMPLASLPWRSEEHTSELQSRFDLVCRLLLEKKKKRTN